jgi:hypothetical protein
MALTDMSVDARSKQNKQNKQQKILKFHFGGESKTVTACMNNLQAFCSNFPETSKTDHYILIGRADSFSHYPKHLYDILNYKLPDISSLGLKDHDPSGKIVFISQFSGITNVTLI